MSATPKNSFVVLCVALSTALSVMFTSRVSQAEPTPVSSPAPAPAPAQSGSAATEVNAQPPSEPAQPKLHGWGVSGVFGGASCLPSGEASCRQTYPGVSLGTSVGYSWHDVAIILDADWGTLTPGGEGSDSVSYRFQHFGLGLRGRFSLKPSLILFGGLSLGPGSTELLDEKSDSSVSWSSFWSDLRIDLGALKAITHNLALEGALSLTNHMAGSRCVTYQGAGPCSATEELPSKQRDHAYLLMARVGVRWFFLQ